jgi:phosphopantetheine adenylyltransferase
VAVVAEVLILVVATADQAEVAALTIRLQADQETHHQHHQVKVSPVDQVLVPTACVEQVVVVARAVRVLTDPQ